MDRRNFLRLLAGACSIAAIGSSACSPKAKTASSAGASTAGAKGASPSAGGASEALTGKIGKNRHDPHPVKDLDCVLSQGSDADAMLKAGLEPYGGIGAFVHKGDTVVLKPNIAWARAPQQAANVQPAVLLAIIKACRDAGAGDIVVVEHPCDSPVAAFELSGAKDACKSANVPLVPLDNQALYRQVSLSHGVNIHQDQISSDILDAAVYIDVPCCKIHSATVVTLGMKNQMGAIWDPQNYHLTGGEQATGPGDQSKPAPNLHQNICDLATGLRPTLTICDATHALVTNGPKGPGKVLTPKSLVISPDFVAADAVACGLMNIKPEQVSHIMLAEKAGLGHATGLTVKRVQAA